MTGVRMRRSVRNKDVQIKHRIVAFSGLMHSGKTSCAEILEHHLTLSVYYPKTIKFAQPLYDIQNYIYDRTGLEKPKSKDRELLQYIGTEWGRKKDPELWTSIWRQEARAYRFKSSGLREDVHVVICDDLRFENEAKLVRELGGIVINVVAPTELRKERNPLTFNENHASEKPLPEELISLNIYNDKDISDLRYNIRYLLEDGII
jgi:hypothetical protein